MVGEANAATDRYLAQAGGHLVRRFFLTARDDIIYPLNAGKPWQGIELGDGANAEMWRLLRTDAWYDPRHRIDCANHVYNKYGCHGIGMDMRYWYVLEI